MFALFCFVSSRDQIYQNTTAWVYIHLKNVLCTLSIVCFLLCRVYSWEFDMHNFRALLSYEKKHIYKYFSSVYMLLFCMCALFFFALFFLKQKWILPLGSIIKYVFWNHTIWVWISSPYLIIPVIDWLFRFTPTPKIL